MPGPYDNDDDVFDLGAAEQRQATAQSGSSRPKVTQPTPQALPSRSGPSSILVSPRQKGNPVLNSIHNVPWEYSDILADYVVGATTCALFLSLKYHRLHPEYIYRRIRDLQGKYALRLVLVIVDIPNHEDPLRELSKTSLVNNVTLMLCWSAAEAGRYLELYKTNEHAQPSSIKVRQSTTFADQMVDFITTPRSINKTDAIGLVSNFGSIRTAMNARPEEVGLIAGWGEKKVQRWCNTVREPFRVKGAQKILGRGEIVESDSAAQGESMDIEQPESTARAVPAGVHVPPGTEFHPPVPRLQNSRSGSDRRTTQPPAAQQEQSGYEPGEDEEAAMMEVSRPVLKEQGASNQSNEKGKDDAMSEGIRAALARLRQGG